MHAPSVKDSNDICVLYWGPAIYPMFQPMVIHSDALERTTQPERIVAPESTSPNEDSIERALRPRALDEYIGQHRVREQLEIFIQAARGRHEALDHVLL